MNGSLNFIRLTILSVLCTFTAPLHAEPVAESFREHIEGTQNRTVDRPGINQAPHKTVLLTGVKDPRVEFRFAVTYITRDEACQSQTFAGRLAGAPEVSQSIIDWVRVPAGQSSFSIPLFLDRYIPGQCGWYPTGTLHAEFEPGVNIEPAGYSGFAAIRVEGKHDIKLKLLCRQATPSRPDEKPTLRCQAVGYSAYDTIIAAEGGVVTIDLSMVVDSGE